MSIEIYNLTPRVYNVMNYMTSQQRNTDARAGIMAAHNAALAAGGGEVYFPLGRYKLPAAPTQSGGAFGQLVLPNVPFSANMPRVIWRGEAPPQWASEVQPSITSSRNQTGVILESDYIYSGQAYPYVIDSAYGATPTGEFSYLYFDMINIVVQTRTQTNGAEIAPTMNGINLSKVVAVGQLESVCVNTQSLTATMLPPTNTRGLILPDVNNKAVIRANSLKIEGFEFALNISEHCYLEDIICAGNINGVVVRQGYHLSTITHAKLEGNKNNILLVGTLPLNILSYDTEHVTDNSLYTEFDYDVKWVSGDGLTTITHSKVTLGTFTHNVPNNKLKVLFGDGANCGL